MLVEATCIIPIIFKLELQQEGSCSHQMKHISIISSPDFAFTLALVDFDIFLKAPHLTLHTVACNKTGSPVTLWCYCLYGEIFFFCNVKCHLPGGNSALIVPAV